MHARLNNEVSVSYSYLAFIYMSDLFLILIDVSESTQYKEFDNFY